MKIMWITNIIIGAMQVKLHGKASNGVWMDALLKDFISTEEHELIIVTTGRNKETIYFNNNKVKYYILPGGNPNEYNHKKNENKDYWKQLINKENPDIIHIWGSEFKQGLAALKAAPNIPSVVFIQGILETIARYYESGIEHEELIKSITFRDIIKRDSILAQKRKYYKRAKYEKEMLEISGNVISENLWCNVHSKAIAPNVKIHYCPLSINEVFEKYQWSYDDMNSFTILCNASGYPLKGLHMILKALHLVKRKYPKVMLLVPGLPMVNNYSLKINIKKTGYMKYIEKQIKKLDLSENIRFIGKLPPEDLAKEMSKANVFVMASALENHSSTLKEAMIVGTPCVASAVGGIPEYVNHGQNGMLYRFEEYEMLANHLSRIFDDNKFAQDISENARKEMIALHKDFMIIDTIIDIYNSMLNSKREGS